MQRADHHAGKVKGAALAILGGIIWRGDPGSIKIRQYAGPQPGESHEAQSHV